VNKDPYGDGWMIRLKVSDPSEVLLLLGSEGYREHIG
jgi:glycine cleavage system H protein